MELWSADSNRKLFDIWQSIWKQHQNYFKYLSSSPKSSAQSTYCLNLTLIAACLQKAMPSSNLILALSLFRKLSLHEQAGKSFLTIQRNASCATFVVERWQEVGLFAISWMLLEIITSDALAQLHVCCDEIVSHLPMSSYSAPLWLCRSEVVW